MTDVRYLVGIALAALLAACGPTPEQRVHQAELNDLAQLKRRYPDVVMGFDLRRDDTLVISVDLQEYIGMDDDAVAALKRDSLVRWRSAWIAEHPHEHALLHLHFIDFIGRRVADEMTRV
ncbi:MAG TPA: hypothetical protein VMT95_06805 [Candidatus Binatia bacterium]|nr:hypothetical protein [Candidatus Binatia bacterium]